MKEVYWPPTDVSRQVLSYTPDACTHANLGGPVVDLEAAIRKQMSQRLTHGQPLGNLTEFKLSRELAPSLTYSLSV